MQSDVAQAQRNDAQAQRNDAQAQRNDAQAQNDDAQAQNDRARAQRDGAPAQRNDARAQDGRAQARGGLPSSEPRERAFFAPGADCKNCFQMQEQDGAGGTTSGPNFSRPPPPAPPPPHPLFPPPEPGIFLAPNSGPTLSGGRQAEAECYPSRQWALRFGTGWFAFTLIPIAARSPLAPSSFFPSFGPNARESP